ncbi:MAG: DUF2367 domain-containing protein [Candidatus Latescibacteria bacterium]|nr:DUF2367 domain-containing protein [Candidatus Latescibacterota bacterium]
MALISCPKCRSMVRRGGFPVWVILMSIGLFPIGLLALLVGRKPTVCPSCRYTW